jgi:hypothetical protein
MSTEYLKIEPLEYNPLKHSVVLKINEMIVAINCLSLSIRDINKQLEEVKK